VRPADINYSDWDNQLEEICGSYCALRLGFRQVGGLKQEEVQLLVDKRAEPYKDIPQLYQTDVSLATLEKLADADAFRSIGLDRRKALWEVSALSDTPTGMYEGQASESTMEKDISLPEMSLPEHVVQDYSATSLSLKAHPVSFVRDALTSLHITATKDLSKLTDGMTVKVAGLVLVRQRPGTASGICFITIEDETGIANLVVFQKLFDKYRKEILQSRLLMVEGKLQIEGEVIHVIVQRCHNLSPLLKKLSQTNEEPKVQTLARGDEKDMDSYRDQDARVRAANAVQTELFGQSRDFR
jgi:error-prone DNA polymerase